MDTSGSLHGPDGFVQAPANTSVDLESGPMAYGSGDSSELSANDPARRKERYDTPPYVQTIPSLPTELLAADFGIVLALWRQ